MKLTPNVGSDRSWVWNVSADISDGEPQAETLAIRFANSENANLFKDTFEQQQKSNVELKKKVSEADNKETAVPEEQVAWKYKHILPLCWNYEKHQKMHIPLSFLVMDKGFHLTDL